MSGRLVILPKKTYCPWKPENVERVLRDERLERERQEKEEKKQRQQESKQRLATLKGNDSSSPPHQQHVNLFDLEEKAAVEITLTGKNAQKLACAGIMPVRLDSVIVQKNKEQPFYFRESVARNDEKCKVRMDPMKSFTRNEARCENKIDKGADSKPKPRDDAERHKHSSRKTRHEKRSSRHESSDSEDTDTPRSSRRKRHEGKRRKRHSRVEMKSGDTFEDLRRKRQEREQNESQREAALRQQASTRNERNLHYQDQFNPSLSRR